MQREQRAKERRRRTVLSGVVAVVVVVVAVVLYFGLHGRSGQIAPSAPTGKLTVQSPPSRVANTTGIKGVIAFDTKGYPAPGKPDKGTLSHDHVSGPVKYAVTPPVGGPHNPIWMNAGVYTKPVPSERAVHNLEHGAIWITYRPSLPKAEVKALTDFVGRQSFIDEGRGQANRYMDLTPWPTDKLPSPIVMSSWGYQLRVTSPTDPRLQKFVDRFRHSQTYTPEYGAAVDGIPVQTGGRPATDGSKQPNPPGTASSQGM